MAVRPVLVESMLWRANCEYRNSRLTPGILRFPRNYFVKVLTYQLPDDGTFPNNTRLPLLVYQAAMELTGKSPATIIELLFADNSWVGSWRNGIYGFHQNHSTASQSNRPNRPTRRSKSGQISTKSVARSVANSLKRRHQKRLFHRMWKTL